MTLKLIVKMRVKAMSCTNEVQCENMECDSNASSSHLNSKSKLSNAKKIKDDDFVEIDYELLVG